MRISDWSSDVCSSDLWSDLTLEQRAEKVGAARGYCAGQIDRLVELSANELGLPVAQNKPRHLASLTYFDNAIEQAKRFAEPELRYDPLTRKTALVSHEPVGVVAAIIPFNGDRKSTRL